MAFSSVNAQDLTGMFNVSPFAGIGIPTGAFQADLIPDDGIHRKMGFKFGVYGEYFFTPNIGAGLDFMYATFGAKDILTLQRDDKFEIIMFGAHAKYVVLPESMIRPYGLAGFGMAMPKWKDFEDPSTSDLYEFDIDSKIYILGEIGVLYFVSPMISVFAEAGGVYIMTEDANTTVKGGEQEEELKYDYNTTFVDIRVGVNVWFGGSE
jgi:opacity protein-like surface antigen